jgi:hypothetical protein
MNAGYIFNFQGHGAFDPNGKIDAPMSQVEIDEHNGRLARAEMESLRKNGVGMLYLFTQKPEGCARAYPHQVGTWASADHERFTVARYRTSRNNFGATRTDVWFYLDGKTWHGVNVGDNDILRVKKNKH